MVGFFVTLKLFPDGVPVAGAHYISIAVLAGLDSVLGGMRAVAERRFKSDIFLSGFFVNMFLAVGLAMVGETIGVDALYIAAVVTLGGRIFLNLSVIRRHWLERHPSS